MTTLEIVLLVLLVIVVLVAGVVIYALNSMAKCAVDIVHGITHSFWR